jgi:hypothetical protein
MVKHLIKILAFALIIPAAGAWAQTRTLLESDPAGWISLMPHDGLKGWVRLALPPGTKLEPASQWSVDPSTGYIVCDGTGPHEWLRYDTEYADFILHAEWRFTPKEGEQRYNSGIFVRNNADGSIWHQAQTPASDGGYLFGNTLVGGKTQRVNLRDSRKENHVNPAGEWNTYEIRCEGKKITLWVNGALANEFTACEVPKGYVGLEAEGYRVEFRNLKLKVLP